MSKTIYQGKVIDLQLDQVTLPNGSTCELEIVVHPGGVGIIALDTEKLICMLRQYRHAAGGWIWEIPAGRLEKDEDPLNSAKRELREEAGREGLNWQPLGKVLSSPGVFTEVIHLFLATDLTVVPDEPEDHEVFEVHWLSMDEINAMIKQGELIDAKTICGLHLMGHLSV